MAWSDTGGADCVGDALLVLKELRCVSSRRLKAELPNSGRQFVPNSTSKKKKERLLS